MRSVHFEKKRFKNLKNLKILENQHKVFFSHQIKNPNPTFIRKSYDSGVIYFKSRVNPLARKFGSLLTVKKLVSLITKVIKGPDLGLG